jgi:glycosyltransferase involved in cell wall biosynthesis
VKLAFWLSTAAPSGGAKVLLEHARRLGARGHETQVSRDARPPRTDAEALVVTRYRDVLPALAVSPRVIHLIQGLDLPEGGPLARLRKRARVAKAFAAPTAKLVVARHLLARFPGALLAPTGVDLSVFHPGPKVPRRVLLSGSGPTKRIDLALRALAARTAPGPLEVVHLLPSARLGEAACAELVRSASVYLSAVSAEEGFDLVALEAMASGTACVLSGGGAHAELAPGLVVPSGAGGDLAAALGAALARCLSDPEESARRIALGLEAARARAWDAVLPAIEAAYATSLTR